METKNQKKKRFSIKDLFKNLSLVISLSVIAVSGGVCAMFGAQNNSLKTKNVELGKYNIELNEQNTSLSQKNSSLIEQNAMLNNQISDLNTVVGDLETTLDRYEDKAAMATFEVDGKVWKFEIVTKGNEIDLPILSDTDTHAFVGWKVEGSEDLFDRFNSTYTLDQSTKFIAEMEEKDWFVTNFVAPRGFDASYVWTDGTNVYYSGGSDDHFVLDPATDTWSKQSWKGLNDFSAYHIWTDGENYYVMGSSKDYVLDVATYTWNQIKFTYPDDAWINSDSIWSDGTNIYSSSYDCQYILDRENHAWSVYNWEGPLTEFYGSKVWTDGTNYYYSNESEQYILNTTTNEWEVMAWLGGDLTNFDGSYIWKMNNKIYYSYSDKQYILDPNTYTWETMPWNGLTNFYANYIWENNGKYYYSEFRDSEICQYELDVQTHTWLPKHWYWTSGADLRGGAVWTDGANYYYSDNNEQYILDVATHTWHPMQWNGLTDFYGGNIFHIGTDIYYLDDYPYCYCKLDLGTKTWENVNWNINPDPYHIWTFGNKYYYSTGSIAYVFNEDTSNWDSFSWNEAGDVTSISGFTVWTDGINCYYVDDISKDEYILDTATNTWSLYDESCWTLAQNIFTFDDDYYMEKYNRLYVLDIETHEWLAVDWIGLGYVGSVNGDGFWTDGVNWYYCGDNGQFVLNPNKN